MRNLILIIVICIFMINVLEVSGGELREIKFGKYSIPTEVEGWKWDGRDIVYNQDNIFEYIDGAGELYRSYNFIILKVISFLKTGHPQITVELYDMGSSQDAYGVFSYERQDEDAGIGQGSEYGGGLLRFWKGRYFVSVYADGEGPHLPSAIIKIGKAISDSIKELGNIPSIISFLPGKENGLLEREIRYFHDHHTMNRRFFVASENILQLGKETEGVIAPYLRQGNKSHLLIIKYPTEEKARGALKSFLKAYMPEAIEKGIIKTEDRKWTVAKVYRNLVIILFGASTEEEAKEMIEVTFRRIEEERS